MRKEDLKVGQTVYVADKTRYSEPLSLTNRVISKVGVKYFEIDRTKYYIETGCVVSDYSSYTKVYLTQQEFIDEQEAMRLKSKMHSYGCFSNLTLDQLTRIDTIINEPK